MRRRCMRAMGRRLAVMFGVALLLATACSGNPETAPISGPWDLVSASDESGSSYTPDPDYDTPWIQVLPEVQGHTGCNAIRQYGPPPEYADGRLTTVSVSFTAAGCRGTVAAIESVLAATLLHEDGIKVTFGGDRDTMRWESPAGGVLEFVRR